MMTTSTAEPAEACFDWPCWLLVYPIQPGSAQRNPRPSPNHLAGLAQARPRVVCDGWESRRALGNALLPTGSAMHSPCSSPALVVSAVEAVACFAFIAIKRSSWTAFQIAKYIVPAIRSSCESASKILGSIQVTTHARWVPF